LIPTTTARKEMVDESGWHVVYTKPRQEARALENLRNQRFDCLLPTLSVDRLRAGHRVSISEPLFPRYLFVHLEAGRSNWSAICSTRGISHLVRFGGAAARIPSSMIAALAEQPAPQKYQFEAGERLKVIDGPFIGIEAELLSLYETPDGEARVMVLMEILSRPQKISLSAYAVRKAA
jgi:transcriptional antiterminator RfaH